MNNKEKRKPTEAEKLREQIDHLAVDLEHSSREGHSVYSQKVDKKLSKLYNLLERIQNVRKG